MKILMLSLLVFLILVEPKLQGGEKTQPTLGILWDRTSAFLLVCQSREETYALLGENAEAKGVTECVDKAVREIKPVYDDLKATVTKPKAEEKLKEYMAVWLFVIKKIPRSAPNRRILQQEQEKDKDLVKRKYAELIMELDY